MTAVIQCQQGSLIRMEILADPEGEHEPMIPEPMEPIGAETN
jgi:hypothetical protein